MVYGIELVACSIHVAHDGRGSVSMADRTLFHVLHYGRGVYGLRCLSAYTADGM